MTTDPLPIDRKPLVKVILYTSKTLSDGSHPLMLRITKDRKRSYKSTGESCQLKYWDKEKEAPRRNHPEQDRLLKLIRKWEGTYSDMANTLRDKGQVVTSEGLIEHVTETITKSRTDIKLLAYLESIYQELLTAKKVGNANVYRDTKRVLSNYLKKKDCLLSAVNFAFLNRFETYMRSLDCADTTLSVYFRTLRAAYNRAIGEKLIGEEHYPFRRRANERDKFSIAKFDTRTRKRAIGKDDIRLIEAVEVNTSRLFLAKHLFLFSYYCGGINFVDMAMLKWKDLHTGASGTRRMHYVRQKTGGLFNLKLSPASEAIIEYYKPFTHANAESYVFPILNRERHITSVQIDNRLHKITGQVNKDLKEIGRLAGIETPLTTYVARHSFATALKNSGVHTAIISEAMGHQTEAITQTYLAEFENELIDEAYENL
ncbi:site-specific integrase [Larkinella sp.]|uniref:site-specific integrase n=1 Tax=Larkinella sp. TaxID=2034517 RepID=UPI003BA9C82B